jgi:hypothetical protein
MSAVPPPPPPAPSPPERERFQAGRFVFGAVVVVFGVAWLLEATDVWSVRWDVVLPVALIVVGLALVVASRSGREQGGLIALGIVLTVVLVAGTLVDVPLEGGVGERIERPQSVAELSDGYHLAVGKLTVDLRSAPLPAGEIGSPLEVRARVGIGQLVVIVPESLVDQAHAKVGIGSAMIFGKEESGFAVRNDFVPRWPTMAGHPFVLDLSVGIGQVEVRDG